MDDAQKEFAEGKVVDIEATSPAWACVRLDDGRIVTAVDPRLSGRTGSEMLPSDRVSVLVLEGYCLIAENIDLASRLAGAAQRPA